MRDIIVHLSPKLARSDTNVVLVLSIQRWARPATMLYRTNSMNVVKLCFAAEKMPICVHFQCVCVCIMALEGNQQRGCYRFVAA